MSPSSNEVSLSRPRQAVILAGGQGTRLLPLTATVPKPMIQFHGKPFLEYLIEMLKAEGFEKVLLLLGYLPGVIQEYFGNGERWNIQIEYSISDVENDTGRRLWLAQSKIDPVFLLLYCDNYWPMRFDDVWKHYQSSGKAAQLTVYRNDDGYTRDNVEVAADGTVIRYDRSRSGSGLRGVDIGFAVLRSEELNRIPDSNVSFEQTVYPQLVERREMGAFVTPHRYYSVGSHARLPLTDQFLGRQPAIILDRDGVLNKKMPRAQYVQSWADWEWVPGSKEAVAMFKRAGYRVIIASNQAGVARGMLSLDSLNEIHRKMTDEIRAAGGDIDAIYFCPHGWDEGCDCRKPKPGMLLSAQREFSLDLTRTPFIGDDDRDKQAADAAGCPCFQVTDHTHLIDYARQVLIH